jgi:hypothetical protein
MTEVGPWWNAFWDVFNACQFCLQISLLQGEEIKIEICVISPQTLLDSKRALGERLFTHWTIERQITVHQGSIPTGSANTCWKENGWKLECRTVPSKTALKWNGCYIFFLTTANWFSLGITNLSGWVVFEEMLPPHQKKIIRKHHSSSSSLLHWCSDWSLSSFLSWGPCV